MLRKERVSTVGTLSRELGQGILLLAISGSTVGGLLGMVSIATRALGR
jgi:hypothetical protein